MPTHLTIPAPGPAHPPVAPAWRPWSKAWTRQVKPIAGRKDLTVIVTPGAGQGAPACHTPADATIEVDADHLGIDPTQVDPTDRTQRPLYATGWGLLSHEAAHARHSTWTALADPTTADPRTVEAALLLEEPRIEAAHLRRRRGDRRWLHAAVASLILPDIDTHDTPQAAARTAALVLARADAGVLTHTEVAAARKAVIGVLGRKRLKKLEVIWRRALRTRDDDHAAMLEWGHRWCRILGDPPHGPLPLPGGPATGVIRRAVEDIATAIAARILADAADARADLARRRRLAARAGEQTVRRQAQAAAETVFAATGTGGRTRPATDGERAAAGQLTRALRAAAHREPTISKTGAAAPPGRLNTRAAMSETVQRRQGQTPVAEPWTRTTRRSNPRPPLRVGISTDVSISMSGFIQPAASTGWTIAQAVGRLPGSASASVTFGAKVTAITRPGQAAPQVRRYDLEDDTRGFVTAVDALDHILGLSQPGHAARMLVVISDGHLFDEEPALGQARFDRLRRAGCALLWIGPPNSTPLSGGQTVLTADPSATGDLITRAVLAALSARP